MFYYNFHYTMGMEIAEHLSESDLYEKLYDDFMKGLSKWEDKLAIHNLKRYLGKKNKENLMKIFVNWYYFGSNLKIIWKNIKNLKRVNYIKYENWENMKKVYNIFVNWIDVNPAVLMEILDEKYNSLCVKVLKWVETEEYKYWEEYLKNHEDKKYFNIWKELYYIYDSEELLIKLWTALPDILFHISQNKGSYYSQYLSGLSEVCDNPEDQDFRIDAFMYAVKKVLVDEGLIDRNCSQKLLEKFRKIVWVYSGWDRRKNENAELFETLERSYEKGNWREYDNKWNLLIDNGHSVIVDGEVLPNIE